MARTLRRMRKRLRIVWCWSEVLGDAPSLSFLVLTLSKVRPVSWGLLGGYWEGLARKEDQGKVCLVGTRYAESNPFVRTIKVHHIGQFAVRFPAPLEWSHSIAVTDGRRVTSGIEGFMLS